MAVGRRARRWTRTVGVFVAVVGMTLTAAACTGSDQAAAPGGAEDPAAAQTTAAPSAGAPITVVPLAPATPPAHAEPADDPDANALPVASHEDAPPATPPSTSVPAAPAATVTAEPAFDSDGIAPGLPIALAADGGILATVSMKNENGKEVRGEFTEDRTGWTNTVKLGFGRTYRVAGVAVNADGQHTRFAGEYTTATTREPVRVTVSPRDGALVGIAAPIMVTFGMPAEDKELIERNVRVVTDPPVEGSWGWVQHAGYSYPTLDWRPKEYWPAGTKVHVEANLYGLKFSDGWYGGDDVTVDFEIGRAQIVKGNAKKNTVKVYVDGKKTAEYHASYGRGDVVGDPNLVTRSGIHVVTSWHETYKMSNPAYGYTDAQEYWAVRISNNGEFIHNNPQTTGWELQNVNKTHGCINMSWDDAKEYFETVLYGDPVEISGTSIELSRMDGDIWIWTVDWDEWLTYSALAEDTIFS